jgi:hypothetical protein
MPRSDPAGGKGELPAGISDDRRGDRRANLFSAYQDAFHQAVSIRAHRALQSDGSGARSRLRLHARET